MTAALLWARANLRSQWRSAVLVVLIAAGGCASTQGGQAGPGTAATLDRIKATKTVTFGYRDSSVPFSFMRPRRRHPCKPSAISAEGRARIAEAQRKRWAALKAGQK